jgi:hypothetical protein
MNKNFFHLARPVLAILIAASLLACAAPYQQPMTHVPQVDRVISRQSSQIPVSLLLSKEQVKVGDTFEISIATQGTGYLYLFGVSNNGQSVSFLFPNDQDYDNRIGTGGLKIPRPNWTLRSAGPAGITQVVGVVSTQVQDIRRLGYLASMGKIEINGPYGASAVPLAEHWGP